MGGQSGHISRVSRRHWLYVWQPRGDWTLREGLMMRVRNPAARFRGYHSQSRPHVRGEHLLTWEENLGWHPRCQIPESGIERIRGRRLRIAREVGHPDTLRWRALRAGIRLCWKVALEGGRVCFGGVRGPHFIGPRGVHCQLGGPPARHGEPPGFRWDVAGG